MSFLRVVWGGGGRGEVLEALAEQKFRNGVAKVIRILVKIYMYMY